MRWRPRRRLSSVLTRANHQDAPHMPHQDATPPLVTGELGADAGAVANGFAAYLARHNPMGVAHKIEVPAR